MGCFLTEYHRGQEQTDCQYAPSDTPDEWSLDDKLLSLGLRRFSKLPDKQPASFGPIVTFWPAQGRQSQTADTS